MITSDELHRLMPFAKGRVEVFTDSLNQTMQRFYIDNPLREAAFLATIAVESGSLHYVQEIASGATYEGRRDLGNTEPGDGIRFKGRGLIQITGRTNYAHCGDALGLDLLAHPDLLESTDNACLSAGFFWQTHGCNGLADKPDFVAICKRVNGGLNGYAQRLDFYERAKTIMGLT